MLAVGLLKASCCSASLRSYGLSGHLQHRRQVGSELHADRGRRSLPIDSAPGV